MIKVTTANRTTPFGTNADETFATAAEMLEIAGYADLNVQKKTLYVGRKGPIVPDKYATVDANGVVRGVVGRTYTVLQMEDALDFGDKIVDDGQAKWGRMGDVKGSVIFATMELSHLDISVPGDDSAVKPYLLIVNSFDGGTPYEGVLAFIRPICENTFQMARQTPTPHRFRIRHVGTLAGKVQMARDAIGIAFKHVGEVKLITERLAMTQLVDQQVREILNAVFPTASDPNGESDNSFAAKTFDNYLASPTLDGIRGTAWGVYNAVTEYIDHEVEYKGRGVNSPEDVRNNALLFGNAQTSKDRAATMLLALAPKGL